jgi:hypothetical protein
MGDQRFIISSVLRKAPYAVGPAAFAVISTHSILKEGKRQA